MATLRKITLNWEIRTGAITCDTGYIKRQELCDVDLYVTVDGTPYALDTSWALNLSIKPALLGDNAALVAVTTWTASATTGLYQATAQTIGGTALDTYLAANNADTTDDEGNKLVDLDVYYTVSMAMQAKSDTVTVICKPDVGRADDTVPATIVARNDFLVTNGTGLIVNVAAGYAANGAFVAAQSSLAITNATNYIEVTAAGVASVNTTAFTAGSYPLATVVASAGAITANTDLRAWITPKPGGGGGSGTVTSVAQSFTGGLISVAGSPITGAGTLALTVAGTSGGIPYFSSGTTWATSAALAANALVVGGGAGAAPATVTTGANVLTALGIAVGSAGAFITQSGGTAGNAASATLAATVTVADEAADTSCFPLFVTAATGSLAAMSNAGLTFNSATGLLSATGLAGAFNGTLGATTPASIAGTSGTFSDAVSTQGASATISTTGNNAHIYTTGASATISTTGDNAHIYTNGATAVIYTTGSSSGIFTQGSNAGIFTQGSNAGILTQGANAHIYTGGSDAVIYTQGANAHIYTGGSDAVIYTQGANAHIYTASASAHIQTRSTFRLYNGTYTTTLSHAPTADRAIALPDADGTLATLAGTETLTNKRITQRSGTATSSATPTINTDNVDFYSLTAQAADITSFTTNLSGTPAEGQTLWIAITGTAARAITWGATFEAGAVALPTTTVTTTRLDVAFVWNTVTSKWRCMASG